MRCIIRGTALRVTMPSRGAAPGTCAAQRDALTPETGRLTVCAWSALLPPVLVFGHYAHGRGVPRTYPACHAPALGTHPAMHATSPKTHRVDVGDSMSPRCADFPTPKLPRRENTGASTHVQTQWHSRVSGQRAPFPTPRASRVSGDSHKIPDGKRGWACAASSGSLLSGGESSLLERHAPFSVPIAPASPL